MKIFHRKLGQGVPFIILHGLYGSSDNWMTIARSLSLFFEVWLVDLRNHGRSPHSDKHTYDSMAGDILELMNDNGIGKANLMGHSMGGKTAINLALKNPNRIEHLIILDIAPKSYLFSLELQSEELNQKKIIERMLNFNLAGLETREQLDIIFSKSIKNTQIRQFLLKNVTRNEDKTFAWKINLKAIYSNLNEILDGVNIKPETFGEGITEYPVLFIKGSNSEYITKDDEESIRKIFPFSQVETIVGAGHWIHVDKPDLLLKSIFQFFKIG